MDKSRKHNATKKHNASRKRNKTQKKLHRNGKNDKSGKNNGKTFNKVVGMITVPLSPKKKFYSVCGDSYIASSHVTWLKRQGVKIVPIPYTTKNPKYYMSKVNGLYFPSGGAFALNSKEYYKICKEFVKLAMRENDKGNYFPIWGGCMGMQQMVIIADEQDNLDTLLTQFDSFNDLLLNLDITEEGRKSKLFRNATPEFMKTLEVTNCTLNNHKMGISPYKFKTHKNINNFYKIVSTNKDRQGKSFVSTIEGRFYPFYGVQWHPERDDTMDYFANFFANELKKNNNKLNKNKTRKLISKLHSKKIDCMNYSNSLYKKCNFYWHKKTSKHNKRLCNVAQTSREDGRYTGV